MTLDDIMLDIYALEDEMRIYERKYGVLSETFYDFYVTIYRYILYQFTFIEQGCTIFCFIDNCSYCSPINTNNPSNSKNGVLL